MSSHLQAPPSSSRPASPTRSSSSTCRSSPPEPGQVRVAVAAASVNPVDLVTRAGILHELGLDRPARAHRLGWDFAGTVLEAGAGRRAGAGHPGRRAGRRLRPRLRHLQEQLVLPAADVAVVPDGLDLVEAATVPLNAVTAAQLVDILGDGDGRSLLVTGAAGAVGGTSCRSPWPAAGG